MWKALLVEEGLAAALSARWQLPEVPNAAV